MHVDFKTRDALIKLIPDHVAAWKEGNREPLIRLRMELGARQWHFERTEKGLSIGTGRKVYIVNPDMRDLCKRHGGIKCFVLLFGAYGDTRLLVYTESLEDALEQCAEWLAKHAPGHITVHGSDEAQQNWREACDEIGVPYDQQPYDDRVIEIYEQDRTYTESGYLVSYEWFIALENPDTETLYRYIHGA